MLGQCLTVLLSLVFLQNYHVDFNNALLWNTPITLPVVGLTVNQINMDEMTIPTTFNGSYTSDELVFDLGSECLTIKMKVRVKGSRLPLTYRVDLCGNATFTRMAGGDEKGCLSTGFAPNEGCQLSMVIRQCTLGLCPPVYTLDLCEVLPEMMLNRELPAPQYPPMEAGASPVTDWRLITAANRIVNSIAELGPLRLESNIPSDTAIHIKVTSMLGGTITKSVASENLMDLAHYLPSAALSALSDVKETLKRIPVVSDLFFSGTSLTNGPMGGVIDILADIPPGVAVGFDFVFDNLKCESDGVACTFPIGGFRMENLGITGFSDFDFLIANLSTLVTHVINTQLNQIIGGMCNEETGLCRIAVPNRAPTLTPPIAVMVCLPVFFVVFTIVIVVFNVRRQRRNPVYTAGGEPLSEKRIIIEDSLFCLFIGFAFTCFLCSNLTTASSVYAGGDIVMYSFSLGNTVKDLWHSGLKALSFFVMLFSGIYPYLKLLVIAVYTVILQCPDALLLKIIDSIGKYSFIDTFVMLILVTGLEIPGIADVAVRPSFYVFMAATMSSLVAGNYATHCWRYNTSIRAKYVAKSVPAHKREPLAVDIDVEHEAYAHEPSYEDKFSTSADDVDTRPEKANKEKEAVKEPKNIFARFARRVWWPVAIPSSLLILGLTLPVWILPCIEYRVGGLAHVIAGPHRRFSLFQLSTAPDAACFIATFVSCLLAPLLFSAFFGALDFCGCWSACDVFLLACLAGLLQLNQFVQFIIGDIPRIYTANAYLQWPLIPMFIGAFIVWCLLAAQLFNARPLFYRLCCTTNDAESEDVEGGSETAHEETTSDSDVSQPAGANP